MEFNNRFTHIGILGGGQLGRMLLQAALDLNLELSILDPDPDAPCQAIAHKFVQGRLTDYQTVLDFGRNCQLVTVEIENVNVLALYQLVKEGIPVYPQPEVIELIQDKRLQKDFYAKNNIPTADFIVVDDLPQMPNVRTWLPAFFKLGKAGYDGRGVHRVTEIADIAEAPKGPGLLEKLVDFQKEISVIVARNANGQIALFPTVELVFHPQHNLVEYLFAPADINEQQNTQAQKLAQQLIESLDMIGLLAVEMFVDADGSVLVNEIAPRPHNSGHHTIEANQTSQYEQHLRAILNLPLGDTSSYTAAAMVNLLGEPGHQGPARYEGLSKALEVAGVHIHFYGKKITKPFRKMGHVTITDANPDSLKEKAEFIKANLKIVS